ncbi:MAG: hypothetical protein ACKVX9_00595 [Blastocatellia bacterium]
MTHPHSASARGAQTTTGLLTFARQVTINGTEAAAGQTIFNGSRVRVGPGGTAVLSLGPLGRIELGGGAEFTLRIAANTLGGDLMIGCMSLSAPGGIGVAVNSNQGSITSDGSLATGFWLGYRDGGTRLIPTMGELRATAGNQTEAAKAGDLLTLSTNASGERSLQRRSASECGPTPCACAPAAIPRTSAPAPRGASAASTTQTSGIGMFGAALAGGLAGGMIGGSLTNTGITCSDNNGGVACSQVSPVSPIPRQP